LKDLLDQVWLCARGRVASPSPLVDLPLPFDTDHPGLSFRLTFELVLDDLAIPPGPVRFRIGQLDNPAKAELFRKTCDAFAGNVVERALSRAEDDCRSATSKEGVREAIDAADSIFVTVVDLAGEEEVLGLYEPQKARARPDKDTKRLEQCPDADSACRLWKRMQRETPSRPILLSEAGRSVLEDVYEHWGLVAGKDLPLERIDPADKTPVLLDGSAPPRRRHPLPGPRRRPQVPEGSLARSRRDSRSVAFGVWFE
jgi:hypothetical protein